MYYWLKLPFGGEKGEGLILLAMYSNILYMCIQGCAAQWGMGF